MPNPTASQTVSLDKYRDIRSRFADAAELLNAIEMFSPMNLAALVKHLDDIICKIDGRLGQLEHRLDVAGVKDPEISDDEAERYFTLPALDGPW
jgi:hypothetical protein